MALGLVVLYFLARLTAKILNAYAAMSLAGATKNVRQYLGISLLPHGGVAVGLILLVENPNSGFSEEVTTTVTTVGLAALAINQLVGPSATRFALQRSGENLQDRPRLLDFLEEHRIEVGLAGNKHEVFQKLASLLYATSPMTIPQDEFIEKIIARDRLETTCLGQGLMIPHAILDEVEENQVKGVLGISSKGLNLAAPTGDLFTRF